MNQEMPDISATPTVFGQFLTEIERLNNTDFQKLHEWICRRYDQKVTQTVVEVIESDQIDDTRVVVSIDGFGIIRCRLQCLSERDNEGPGIYYDWKDTGIGEGSFFADLDVAIKEARRMLLRSSL
ncbi:hypothetical protein GCM10023213_07410 [Prosthecobacter algae]|uniref:Uncharacterized protein n=1 Tax=Prosthecobacter algae TaxID=1144682 RepID=A0ABP9NVW4_9BACT